MANPVADLLMAEVDGATFHQMIDGRWSVLDRDGAIIAQDAESMAEAARSYLELTAKPAPSTPDAVLKGIVESYDGYDKLPEFRVGFDAHESGRFHNNPYHPDSVAAQAWDRGYEAAARYARALDAAQRGAVVERCRNGKAVR